MVLPGLGEKRGTTSSPKSHSDESHVIDAMRQKLILDLKTAADKMKNAILRNEENEERCVRQSEKKPNISRNDGGAVKLPKLRSDSPKTLRPKFFLELSRKEIDEDFIAMVGHRPLRKPKKRPRVEQKQLDTLFPGCWLTEVTPDLYKVPEALENGKARKRKGKMHLSDSDEES